MQILTSPRTRQEAEPAPEKPINIGVSRLITVPHNALTAAQRARRLNSATKRTPKALPRCRCPGTAQPRAGLAARHRQRDDTDIPLGRWSAHRQTTDDRRQTTDDRRRMTDGRRRV